MTKMELERLSPQDYDAYFEHNYPYVLPENDVVDVLDERMMRELTALEVAYVRWMVETNHSSLAVERFIHPAMWFDKEKFGAAVLKKREHLKVALRYIRRNCPYLRLYSGDYLAGIIHEEIQYLRSAQRKDRFFGPNANPALLMGKKSQHDQEMEEIDRLLKCVDQIHQIKQAVVLYGTPDAKQGDTDSRIDRVLAGAAKQIEERENRDDGRTRGST